MSKIKVRLMGVLLAATEFLRFPMLRRSSLRLAPSVPSEIAEQQKEAQHALSLGVRFRSAASGVMRLRSQDVELSDRSVYLSRKEIVNQFYSRIFTSYFLVNPA